MYFRDRILPGRPLLWAKTISMAKLFLKRGKFYILWLSFRYALINQIQISQSVMLLVALFVCLLNNTNGRWLYIQITKTKVLRLYLERIDVNSFKNWHNSIDGIHRSKSWKNMSSHLLILFLRDPYLTFPMCKWPILLSYASRPRFISSLMNFPIFVIGLYFKISFIVRWHLHFAGIMKILN